MKAAKMPSHLRERIIDFNLVQQPVCSLEFKRSPLLIFQGQSTGVSKWIFYSNDLGSETNQSCKHSIFITETEPQHLLIYPP